MRKIFLIAAAMMPFYLHASCNINEKKLGAEYSIQQQSSKKNTVVKTEYLNLWRNGNQVALQNPQAKITEIWTLLANDRLRPVRYFDAYQRAIEYQPGDIKINHNQKNWHEKYQLISDIEREGMKVATTQGHGCQREILYLQKNATGNIRLIWLPELKLVKEYTYQNQGQHWVWKLNKIITDHNEIEQIYRQRQQYMSTDFVDIGDNENDPFLQKMIHLGFIAHGVENKHIHH